MGVMQFWSVGKLHGSSESHSFWSSSSKDQLLCKQDLWSSFLLTKMTECTSALTPKRYPSEKYGIWVTYALNRVMMCLSCEQGAFIPFNSNVQTLVHTSAVGEALTDWVFYLLTSLYFLPFKRLSLEIKFARDGWKTQSSLLKYVRVCVCVFVMGRRERGKNIETPFSTSF